MEKIYHVENDYIVVHDTTNFIPRHILDCGQVFRYEKVGNLYKIISNNRFCTLINNEDYVIIKCKDIEYFIKYFDLDRDYSAICDKLTRLGLQKETEFGRGIRILNQDKFEMIISFIISANNHIPRIKAIIERLCKSYGENMGEYYAFPTPQALAKATITELRLLGAGYRAEYILDTAQRISKMDNFDELEKLDDYTLKKKLMEFSGVGPKVADCIMLFGYNRFCSFPVDTWIVKTFHREKKEAKKLERELTQKYGELSGFAQQYIFYHSREQLDI